MAAWVAALLRGPGLNLLSCGFLDLGRQRRLQGVSHPERDEESGVFGLTCGSVSVIRLARPKMGTSSSMSARFRGWDRGFSRKALRLEGNSAEAGAKAVPMVL